MDYFFAIILGIVQGITEWLPISSTAHLILTEKLFGLDTNTFNLTFNAAIQLGTTFAVIYFFRADLWNLVRHWRRPAERKMIMLLLIATIPAGLAGLAFKPLIADFQKSLFVIALALLVGGFVFLWIERYAQQKRDAKSVGTRDALVIGIAQALALIPGVSRSGSTIVGGMLLGLKREAAARFAFLMSIPIILLAGGKEFYDAAKVEGLGGQVGIIVVGMIVSALVGYLTIKFLLQYLGKHSLGVFAYYRFALAGLLLLILAVS